MRVYSFLTQRPGERKGTQGILGARFPQRVQNPLLDEIKSTKGTHSHEAFFNAFSAFEFPAAGDFNPWQSKRTVLPHISSPPPSTNRLQSCQMTDWNLADC